MQGEQQHVKQVTSESDDMTDADRFCMVCDRLLDRVSSTMFEG